MPFNCENAYKVLIQTSRDFRQKAIKRLELYASHLCMKCTNTLLVEGEEMLVMKSNREFQIIKIKNEDTGRETKEVAKCDHLLCFRCINKISEDIKTKKRTDISSINKILSCKICEEDHFIDPRDYELIFKKDCCDSCIIY